MKDEMISDRKLERLALGEIPEDEANALLKVLEERGELHRFEELIVDNEAFVDAHPPGLLAAQVREELRRSQRNREEDMVSPRVPFLPFAIAIAVMLVVAGAWFAAPAPKPAAEAEVAKPAAVKSPVLTNPVENLKEKHPPAEEAAESEPVLVNRGEEFEIPETLYAPVGAIYQFDTAGVGMVAVGNQEVAQATGSDEVLYLEAKAAGNAVIKFWRKGPKGPVVWKSFMFTVGDVLPGEQMMPHAEGKASLLDCAVHADNREVTADVTIVLAGGGAVVGNLFLRGSEESKRGWDDGPLRECVEKRIDGWRLVNKGELAVGRLNFDFGSGAVCQPGDDGC